ncbi:uncharacterized protein LOC141607265 [Silene latifolia]|uniref:uncharacterized protein LOC141607265 n=1 Tax=Silene latifolia TaxID=37657 RepID=UPI003D77A6B7
MEYLSRNLTYSTGANEFKYYPMCKQMKLTHLMFANDLLLFCKGDGPSIMTILRSFATLSKTSCLNMSKGKSNAYFNGVNESLKQDILRISGMVEGALPFKYLGVPIKTTRLNAKDCKPLIDKIVQRIRNLEARKLSYAVYIKGDNWLKYSPTNNSSWSWRKICCVKTLYQESYQHHIWATYQGREYSITKGYDSIRNKGERVQWHQLVWNKCTIPKHRFLTWIHMHNALNTKEKLHKLGISDDDTCEICRNGTETASHLFFACEYSSRVLTLVGGFIGESISADAPTEWRRGMKGSGMRKDIINAIINACIYSIWKQQNLCKPELILLKSAKLVNQIIKEVTGRTLSFPENLGVRDREWLEGLRIRS